MTAADDGVKIAAALATLSSRMTAMETGIERIERALFIGNGRPPFTVVVGNMDERLERIEKRCSSWEKVGSHVASKGRASPAVIVAIISASASIVCAYLALKGKS